MKDNPNIFFVVLTGANGPIAINVADIVHILPSHPRGDGSDICLRIGDDALICKEQPDEVARKINAALSNTMFELAQVALKIAGRL